MEDLTALYTILCIIDYNHLSNSTAVLLSRDSPKMMRALKINAQKKQLISILRDEKHLTYTALTFLNPDIVHKTMQQLQKLKYGFLKKSLKLGFPCLPDHIHKPRG